MSHRIQVSDEDYMELRKVLAEQATLSTIGEAVAHVLTAYRRRPHSDRRRRED